MEILNPRLVSDSKRIIELMDNSSVKIIDTLNSQLEELIRNRYVEKGRSKSFVCEQIEVLLAGVKLRDFGLWVYYPWKGMLAHVLPSQLFNELRFVRNKYKITDEEQKKLGTKKIGIIGLSVGDAICQTLVQEGIGGEMRIADFDNLDLSNLNRIHAGILDIGVPKTTLTKQKISESNPFIKIVTFSKGVTSSNIDDFFLDGGKLDLLIEECDQLEIKIEVRKKAKELGVPVLMDTSDNEILDIERYDLDKGIPILHGLISEKEIFRSTKNQLLHKILPIELLSERMNKSLPEIGKSINSWPQLASSVQSGAGFTVMAARYILLSKKLSSKRICLNLQSYLDGDKNDSIS